MITFHRDSEYKVLFLIAVPKVVVKAVHLMEEEGFPVHYQFFAQGTASSRIMDILGLGGVDKLVLCTLAPDSRVRQMLALMREKLQLKKPNSGVAFSVSLTAGTAGLIRMAEPLKMEKRPDSGSGEGADGNPEKHAGNRTDRYPSHDADEERMRDGMKDQEYSMIVALVNQGFSEDVMQAAHRAGAKGGTVFHCRRAGSEEAAKFWGITIQQEREVVLILAPRTAKAALMEAINTECGVKSEAQGVVLSLPVEDIVGLVPVSGN